MAPILLVLLTLWASVFAISVPQNITANQPLDLTIKQGIDADSDLRKRFNSYRVYVALEPPGWGTGPVCWLAHSESLDTTQVNITIPADVAPDKSRIRIATSLFKKGASRGNGYSYSSKTTLVGGNGTWSQRELDGWNISDEGVVSCWAFGCVRQCNVQFYTGDRSRYSDGTSDKKTDSCVKECVKRFNPRSGAARPTLGLNLMVLGFAVEAVYMFL